MTPKAGQIWSDGWFYFFLMSSENDPETNEQSWFVRRLGDDEEYTYRVFLEGNESYYHHVSG